MVDFSHLAKGVSIDEYNKRLKLLIKPSSDFSISAYNKQMFSSEHKKMSDWRRDFPNENIDEDYMLNELNAAYGAYLGGGGPSIDANNVHGWINNVGCRHIAYTAHRMRNCTHYPHACFYNSLDAVRKNHNKGYQLAFGIRLKQFEKLPGCRLSNRKDSCVQPRYRLLLHAFLVKDGVVYDPTLGSEPAGNYTFLYEIVPKSVWFKFNHKEKDSDYDATDFARYIEGKLLRYSKPILPSKKSKSRRSL